MSAFADFNRTSGLIDIPTAGGILPNLGYRIGLDGSVALDSKHSVDDFDKNIHASIGLGGVFETYLDIYTLGNFTAAIGFCNRFYKTDNLQIAWGIHQLSYSLDVSEVGHGDSTGWDDDLDYSTKPDYKKPFELGSAFLVSSFLLNKNIQFTVGLGRGRYVGYGPHSKYFNSDFYHDRGGDWAVGFITGVELKVSKNFSLLFDLDGRDANAGFRVSSKPIEFSAAIAKIEQFGMSFSPRVSASLSITGAKKPQKPCIISGTVFNYDGKTLPAKVGILNLDIPQVIVTDTTGSFQFKMKKAGAYTVYAEADGYLGRKRTVNVKPDSAVVIALVLKEIPPQVGDFEGYVFDLKTKRPVIAKLSLDKTSLSAESDSLGNFTFTGLKPGVYEITAEAPGYEQAVTSEVITAGEKNRVEIGMVKKGMVITIKGIKFDFNKATIKPESYPILDKAAKILKTHPTIRVEIQGHTDSVGSDAYNLKLSDARANAVRDYLIKNHSIDASRLLARGYGERRPVASNKTAEGRAQNRRVDFAILK